MSRLADIELQSIMHFLPYKSLLAVARTSRRAYLNAGVPFAWKHHPPYCALLMQGLRSFDSARFHKSVLRHLATRAIMIYQGPAYVEVPSLIASLLQIPRLVSLTFAEEHSCSESQMHLPDAEIQPLLDHSSVLQQVHTLAFDFTAISALSKVADAGGFPSLTSLSPRTGVEPWSSFGCNFPHLRSLSVRRGTVDRSGSSPVG
jgi:hypothetical protein